MWCWSGAAAGTGGGRPSKGGGRPHGGGAERDQGRERLTRTSVEGSRRMMLPPGAHAGPTQPRGLGPWADGRGGNGLGDRAGDHRRNHGEVAPRARGEPCGGGRSTSTAPARMGPSARRILWSSPVVRSAGIIVSSPLGMRVAPAPPSVSPIPTPSGVQRKDSRATRNLGGNILCGMLRLRTIRKQRGCQAGRTRGIAEGRNFNQLGWRGRLGRAGGAGKGKQQEVRSGAGRGGGCGATGVSLRGSGAGDGTNPPDALATPFSEVTTEPDSEQREPS